jgi:hypothetical protein
MPPGLARRPSGRTAAGCKQAAGLTGNQGPPLRSRPACFEGYLRLSGNRFFQPRAGSDLPPSPPPEVGAALSSLAFEFFVAPGRPPHQILVWVAK